MDIQLDKKNTVHHLSSGIVALALVVFTLLFLWLMTLFSSEKVIRIPFASASLHPVQRQTFTDTMVARAVAIPNESVIIASERGGIVTNIRQNASSEVKKGDVIAQLSNDDFVLQVTSRIAAATEQINNLRNMRRVLEKDNLDTRLARQDAHYQVEKHNKDVMRKKMLYERGMMEKASYEQLRDELTHWKKRDAILTAWQQQQESLFPSQIAEIESSLKHLEQLTQQIENGLQKLIITAPIDGLLSPLTLKIGQQVKPGEKIANVDNTDSYYFEAAFSEYYLDKIKLQDNVSAHYAGVDIPLIISSISSVVENGKFITRLKLAHPQPLSLKRGQSIDLRISLEAIPDALTVPSDAIFVEQEQKWIYLYDEKHQRALKTPVVIKRQGETQSEVLRGLSAGQQVVVFTDRRIDKYDIIEFEKDDKY